MKSSVKIAAIVIVAAAAAFILAPASRLAADEIQQVFVTNFPSVFPVEGTVAIKAPLKTGAAGGAARCRGSPGLAEGHRAPDQRRDARLRWVHRDGPEPARSDQGEVVRTGRVGAILIPDDEPIVRAFDEKGAAAIRARAGGRRTSRRRSTYFASNQPRFPIAFPRYRVYFYNTADKSVTVNFYAYMTN